MLSTPYSVHTHVADKVSSLRRPETFWQTVLAKSFDGRGPSCRLTLDTPRRSAVLRKDGTDLAKPARLGPSGIFQRVANEMAGRHEAKTWPTQPRKMQVDSGISSRQTLSQQLRVDKQPVAGGRPFSFCSSLFLAAYCLLPTHLTQPASVRLLGGRALKVLS